MEDKSNDLQIYEYPSLEEEINSKVAWILSKGMRFGKKVMVAGILVSSAPVLLPPLVALSALSFMFCVPFGLAYAGYACTEKLMSKLLPMPTSPLMLGYITKHSEEEDDDDVGAERGILMEEEDKEQLDYTKEGIEMIVETVEERSKELILGSILQQEGGSILQQEGGHNDRWRYTERYRQESIDDLGQEVEEDGYKKDVGEDLEGEDGGPVGNNFVQTEGIGNEEEKKLRIEERKDKELLVELRQFVYEDEVIVTNGRANRELMTTEMIIQEEMNDEAKAMDNQEEDEIARETTGLLKRIGNEGLDDILIENEHQVKKLHVVAEEDEIKRPSSRKDDETISKEDVGSSCQSKKSFKYKKVELDNHTHQIKVNGDDISKEINQIGQKEGCGGRNHVSSMPDKETKTHKLRLENVIIEEKKENMIYSDANIRETADKSGLDMFDDKIVFGDSISSLAKRDTSLPSDEVYFTEEIIWQQIDAVRTIVGYKAAPQLTCVGELKALYVFTGIEPPSMFKDPVDLAEVAEKLHFLMSVIGVK